MLRRVAIDRNDGSPPDEQTRPMTAGLPLPRPPAVAARSGFRERLRAAALHLLACIAVVAMLSVLVFGAWYPSPMPQLLGVGAILWIVVGVDVVVGPLFTLIVFDRRKPRLKWDLATICALQLAALAYGVHTVYEGRPGFVVFAKDRFEIVAPADLKPEDRAAAASNPQARLDLLRPRWVAARQPESASEQSTIMMDALSTGRDIQHLPRLYVDYAAERAAALERALPISRLRTLNPGRGAQIDALVAASGRADDALRYLPLRGPAGDGAVLIDAKDAAVVTVAALVPW
jgi:hypothetical protein